METLLTLKQASEKTKIGTSTIRKYVGEFADFISVEKGARNALMFTQKAIEALKLIKKSYKARLAKEDILAQLVGKPVKKATKPVKKTLKASLKKVVKVKKPVELNKTLAQEPTIQIGYHDQQADQGLW